MLKHRKLEAPTITLQLVAFSGMFQQVMPEVMYKPNWMEIRDAHDTIFSLYIPANPR